MSNKVYFPKNESFNEFFSFAVSTNGWVIPLNYFDYPNIHITIYVKEMENKKDWKKLSIHITKDNKIIDEFYLEWNEKDPKLEEKYLKKSIKFMNEYSKIFEKYKITTQKIDEKNIICYDCLYKQKPLQLDTKSRAKKAFNSLIERIKNERLNYPNYKECQNNKHNVLMNIETGQMYRQTSFGLFTFSNTEKFIEEFGNIIEKVFSDEFKWLEEVKNKLSKTLDRYKLK